MKINIRIKPRARCNKVEKTEDGYIVYVKEPPIEYKANNALIKLLSCYFDVPKSRIRIVVGLKSKNKIIEIEK